MKRRALLQWSACSPLFLASMAPTQASGGACLYPLSDGSALRVERGCTHFDGEGLYLYPAWGQPQVYLVRKTARGLAFHEPRSGLLRWQSLGVGAFAPIFAGKVIDQVAATAGERQNGNYALRVPRLPSA